MSASISVTILTGFLGSGKTTLLNHLLHVSTHRLAVIINEFGAVGVDGAMLQHGTQFVELSNGCLCCVLNDDLDATLKALLARGGFDHLILETTGMADPLPIGWTFSRPAFSAHYRLDAIVTVIDAANIADVLTQAPEAALQIQRADILLLNKLDLVQDHGAAATAHVRALNAQAPLLHADFGTAAYDLIIADNAVIAPHAAPSKYDLKRHHHQASFDTWTFVPSGLVSDKRLDDFLYTLPASIYRIKGLLQTDAGWDWTLINMVAGRIDMRPFEVINQMPKSCLVFIGPNLDKTWLENVCAQLLI